MWSGPNSKNPDAFMLDASASSFASDKGTAGDSTCPDLGTCNVDAANKANASTARGNAQADEPPVIVTSPLPDLKKDNGEPIKPYASRFIRIEAVALAHFDKGKPMDVLSSMVSVATSCNE